MKILDKLKTGQEPEKQLPQAIGKNEIAKAQKILQEYMTCKTNLNARLKENQQWFRERHWDEAKTKRTKDPEPVSAWLLNAIINKHADAMDNYPAPAILPREANDEKEAETLSSILPLILEENDFEQTYNDYWYDKLIAGTCCIGVSWDKDKLNGLGDIAITAVDLLNMYWEPGITNIQDSSNVFLLSLASTDNLRQLYPDANIKQASEKDYQKYQYDDKIPTENKSLVVEWYYKKNGRLHYCKYCGLKVLYATENDEKLAQTGLYEHGEYPFIFDTTFPIKGSLCGFGFVDIMKDPQMYIDKLNQALLKNAVVNAKPRFFASRTAKIDIKKFADTDNDIIEVNGTDLAQQVRPIETSALPGVYVTLLQEKIAEIKETSGNRDVSNGGTTSGVTAASAIAAMQEASGKPSRDIIKSGYRAYAEIIRMCIELIRQFYDEPRTFRITNDDGTFEYEEYSNNLIKPQVTGQIQSETGLENMYRKPVFDVKVSAQKASVYSQISQNELAKEFYSAGFFRPDMADQALACVNMMDFDGKDKVIKTISQNKTLYDIVMQQQQQMTL